MKVLITGKNGQVGTDLVKSVPKRVEFSAFNRHELDITSSEALQDKIHEIKPDYIINAAAYTAVDRAEKDQELAHLVNANAVGNLAQQARAASVKLFHLSTDFVFDGQSSTPYPPDATINPLSVYGRSKAEGEALIRKHYAAGSIILRTSWVYSRTGRNFVKAMLTAMKERHEVRVVVDQVGSPTWSKNLALTIWAMITNNALPGIYHWTDAGVASWYDFAYAVFEEASALELLDKKVKIVPIPTSQYSTPARRPPYSVLDASLTNKIWGVQQEHWRTALRKMLVEHKKLVQISNELIK